MLSSALTAAPDLRRCAFEPSADTSSARMSRSMSCGDGRGAAVREGCGQRDSEASKSPTL